jgi:predicted DNA-binding transcriptional regulator YafY
LAIVAEFRKGAYLSAPQLVKTLSRCRGLETLSDRTVRRDIEFLRCHWLAPIDYSDSHHGFHLHDPHWQIPFEQLQGDPLFAALLSETLTAPLLPGYWLSALDQAKQVQLQIGDPDALDCEALNAIVFATGAKVDLQSEIFDGIATAWRDCRQLRIAYQKPSVDEPTSRTIDIHALFLADGAWYARAYCHSQHSPRTFALHRISDFELTPERFTRSTSYSEDIRSGNAFAYEAVEDIRIRCAPEKAQVIGERIWFPGQQLSHLSDGGLELHFPRAPKPTLIRWVLSYGGHLSVVHPPEIVDALLDAAKLILKKHHKESLKTDKYSSVKEELNCEWRKQ